MTQPTKVRFGDVVAQGKDVVDVEAGVVERYVAGEHMDSDDLHVRRYGTLGDGYLGPAFHRGFRAGQVLYGSRRTYLRKVAVPDFDGVCANTTFVCEPADDRLLSSYLPWVMRSTAFHEHSVSRSKGSVNPYVNWKDIAAFEFSVPSRVEQERLAGLLWSADDACEAHRTALLSCEAARGAVLASHMRHATRTVPLADVARFVNGTTFPKRYQGSQVGDYPHFKVADMNAVGNERELRLSANWITKRDAAEMGARVIPAGSIGAVRIPVATPEQQQDLANRISRVDALGDALRRRLDETRQLTQRLTDDVVGSYVQ